MNILILSHFYPPEMGAAAARLHGLARWMVHDGHQVTVITGFPNYPSGVIPEHYRGKWRQREQIDGVQVIRTWLYASSHRSTWRRLGNYFSFVASSTLTGLTIGGSYDVVVTSSPPLFLGLSGLFVAQLRRIPWVFDLRDLWPQIAVESGEFSADAWTVRFADRLAHFFYRRADHLIPVTESKRQKLLALGIPATKMSVVTNGVDFDDIKISPPKNPQSTLSERFTPSHSLKENKAFSDKYFQSIENNPKEKSQPSWRQQLGLEGKFVVLYAGLIGIAQGVDRLLDAAETLRTSPNIHLLIVGDGVRRSALVARVEQQALTNVTILPTQPRSEILAMTQEADICFVPLLNSALQDAVPSKLLEAWACGRPVLLTAAGEAAQLVDRCQGGVVIAPEASRKLAQAILTCQAEPERLMTYAQNGYEYVRQHFDRAVLARRFVQVLQRAIQESVQ